MVFLPFFLYAAYCSEQFMAPFLGKTQESDIFSKMLLFAQIRKEFLTWFPFVLLLFGRFESALSHISLLLVLCEEKNSTQFLLVVPGSHSHKPCNCIWGTEREKYDCFTFSISSILLLLFISQIFGVSYFQKKWGKRKPISMVLITVERYIQLCPQNVGFH